MNGQGIPRISEVLADIVARIRRYRDRGLGEQNTKASLVEPVLEALGWDVRDPDEVYREFKPTPRDCPVDYALTIQRKARLFVEAKGLGETLADRRWISQILGYATVAGVEWCVLTDGNEYRLYNATAAVDADEKLFCKVRLSDDSAEQISWTLHLISRDNMAENLIDVLWKEHWIDRRVRTTLNELFERPDPSLVRLLRKRHGELGPRELIESIRRLNVRFEQSPVASNRPTAPVQTGAEGPRKKRKNSRKRLNEGRPRSIRHYGVELSELIRSGIIKAPARVHRRYKGKLLEALILADGTIDFDGERYASPSTAAETARASLTGRKMHTNGWDFWQLSDEPYRGRTLAEARERYLSRATSKQTK